jgi:hypothetical protein
MHPLVKLRLSSYTELFKAKFMLTTGAVWGLIGLFSLFRTEFLSEKYQRYTAINLLAHLSLRTWIYVALILVIGILLEGGHAAICKRDQEISTIKETNHSLDERLHRALTVPSGPEIAMQYLPPNQFIVRNLRGGTAHNIVVHPFKSGTWTILGKHIDYLKEGGQDAFSAMIQGASGVWPAGDHRLRTALQDSEKGKSFEEKTGRARLPIRITFWDGGDRDFIQELLLEYNFITEEMSFTLTDRRADLRSSKPHPAL